MLSHIIIVVKTKMDIIRICHEVRTLLEKAVEKSLTDGILISGGLDSSILAYLASKHVKLKAFTAAMNGAEAPDVEYAKIVADQLELSHYIHRFGEKEILEMVPKVVKALKLFDPMRIRYGVKIAIAMNIAKEKGLKDVITGDGGNELFANYRYLFPLKGDRLKKEIDKMWKNAFFSSFYLADHFGIKVKAPYLNGNLKSFARGLDPELKVHKERGRIWGAWIQRKAFENVLPEEIIWRPKSYTEAGFGANIIPNFFDFIVSDEEFNKKVKGYFKEDKVIIRSKEQLYYYEIYRLIEDKPKMNQVDKAKVCPYCNANLPYDSTYCRICGARLS
jgi:asparagine synthase (glutamine-hydrolysing)